MKKRERVLYKNFVQVGQDVKEMIKDVQNKRGEIASGKRNTCNSCEVIAGVLCF